MSDTEQAIVQALAELRCARHEHDHCPSQDNAITVAYAEQRLNRLLDRRSLVGEREKVRSR